MRPPKLHSEDITSLRRLFWAARLLEKADREYDGITSAFLRGDIRRVEKLATLNALYWWENVPSAKVSLELNRWWATHRWQQTRAGWRSFRLIKGRREYAKRPTDTRIDSRPADVFIRL